MADIIQPEKKRTVSHVKLLYGCCMVSTVCVIVLLVVLVSMTGPMMTKINRMESALYVLSEQWERYTRESDTSAEDPSAGPSDDEQLERALAGLEKLHDIDPAQLEAALNRINGDGLMNGDDLDDLREQISHAKEELDEIYDMVRPIKDIQTVLSTLARYLPILSSLFPE